MNAAALRPAPGAPLGGRPRGPLSGFSFDLRMGPARWRVGLVVALIGFSFVALGVVLGIVLPPQTFGPGLWVGLAGFLLLVGSSFAFGSSSPSFAFQSDAEDDVEREQARFEGRPLPPRTAWRRRAASPATWFTLAGPLAVIPYLPLRHGGPALHPDLGWVFFSGWALAALAAAIGCTLLARRARAGRQNAARPPHL